MVKINLPELDDELLKNLGNGPAPYKVDYLLFNSKKAPKNVTLRDINKIERESKKKLFSICGAACFSSINYGIDLDYNMLAYKFNDENVRAMKKISTKEVRRWLKTCKKYNLLDESVAVKFGVKYPYTVMKIDEYTKNQLYVYICAIRYLAEFPYFVRLILTLMDFGLPFYSAFVAASRTIIDRSVHHIIDVTKYYCDVYNTNNKFYEGTIPIGIVGALKLFVSNYKKYDSSNVYNGSFRCCDKINTIANKIIDRSYEVTIKELFTNELKAFAEADNIKDMKKCLDNYKNATYNFIIPKSKLTKKVRAKDA